MNKKMNKKMKTMLNKKYRLPISINARKFKGNPILYASFIDSKNWSIVERVFDTDTANGGTLTPFNIQCNCCGACAIRTIVKRGDETIVVFGDGDRVCLNRHEGDKDDPVTAVLWALGQKVFGKNLARQIHNALNYRLVDADKKHQKKVEEESVSPYEPFPTSPAD